MNIPENLKYAESHEWISVEGDIGTVGITDHAQQELTDIVYVELPEVGREAGAGDPVAVVESVKAASDIYSPVSGEILEVNEALQDDPALINTSAFTDGWLFKIRLTNPADLDGLKSSADYAAQIS